MATALPRLTHANCNSRLKSLKLILFRVLFMDPNRLPRAHLRRMFLFFNIFLFFNLIFLGANIKTDKLVVSTDEIVDSPAKLLATSKTLPISDKEIDLIRTAPEGSFLERLARKSILVMANTEQLNRIKGQGIDNFVAFADRVSIVYYVFLLAHHASEVNSIAFMKSTDYYERLGVFQMRRSLDEEQKRFINRRWLPNCEFGFLILSFSNKIKTIQTGRIVRVWLHTLFRFENAGAHSAWCQATCEDLRNTRELYDGHLPKGLAQRQTG